MNCLLLTEKSWHDSLFNNLKKSGVGFWHRIVDKNEATIENIRAIDPAWIFVPHWSYIIPSEIYDNYRCVVFHMTDVPFGRGGSPLQNLIIRDYNETKISAIKVAGMIDAGDIYLKRPLPLYGTAEEIFIRASSIIEEMIFEILNNEIMPEAQQGEVVNFNRRSPSESDISKLKEIQEVYDFIRMLDADGYPKAFIETDSFKFEFTRCSLKGDQSIIADVRITKK